MPGLRRLQRAEAHLGLRGSRFEGVRGTQPCSFERLRVRWRLQLSWLTSPGVAGVPPEEAKWLWPSPAGDGS
jgi:hypothetical protein